MWGVSTAGYTAEKFQGHEQMEISLLKEQSRRVLGIEMSNHSLMP